MSETNNIEFNLSAAVDSLKEQRGQLEKIELIRKETKHKIEELETMITEHFAENFHKSITMESGEKITAKWVSKYTIQGGNHQTPQRQTVLETLVSCGLLDTEDIEVFENVHGTRLNGALGKLAANSPDRLQELLAEKCLSIWNQPRVTIK